jgi:hypothetical protein
MITDNGSRAVVSNVIFENVEDIELGLLQISANDIHEEFHL